MTVKILIGLTYYKPNISGVTEYASILAEELEKRKHEIKIITSKFKKGLVDNDKIKRIAGMAIGKGFIMPTYFFESIKLVKWAEVVNCHLPSIESFWLVLWAKIFKKKSIVTHHCEFQINGNLTNIFIGIVTYPIHFFVYLLADKIVAYTKDYADTSIFLRFFKNKIIYILPPIKIKNLKSKNLKSKSKKVVGFVGRIGWEKGLEYLIEAMKSVEAELILVGPYKDVAGDETYKTLKGVKLVGPIERNKLNKYYGRFDCLVLPSTNNLETFGIVQAEAMICGCPVVASNLPGVRVPVQITGMGEICQIKNSLDLAEKINLVLKNGKKYYQQKAKNLELFDYRKTIDSYEKLISLDDRKP
jgi:glycosyltransferase involved in cell wall biosynthesis